MQEYNSIGVGARFKDGAYHTFTKPRTLTHNLKEENMSKNTEKTVVVISEEGKEVTLPERLVGQYINLGFTLKSKKDMPSEEVLAESEGYNWKLAGERNKIRGSKDTTLENEDTKQEPQRSETYVKEVVAKLDGEAKKRSTKRSN